MRGSGSKAPKTLCNCFHLAVVLVLGWIVLSGCYCWRATAPALVSGATEDLRAQAQLLQNLSVEIAQTKTVLNSQHLAIVDLQKAAARTEVKPVVQATGDDAYHIVFSTDCSFFQDWQTLLVFHSAVQVGQKGLITRIASGCDDARQAELKALYQKLYPQYHVHFTPDFKTDGKSKKKYDFYNKPYGVQHWLKHADPPVPSGTVVNIIDPDMVLLRPMTPQVRGDPANIFLNDFHPATDIVPKRVERGVPVSQLYGITAPWVLDNHANFNRTHVCGAGSPCLKTTLDFANRHFSVGPPYMVEKDDLVRLVTSWTDMVPRVYEKYPSLLAEMYAYSMAAAHTELPHFTLLNLMVSNVDEEREGWKWVDALQDDVCVPQVEGVFYPNYLMPSTLHYCQIYRAGEFSFYKRFVKEDLFKCDQPILADLPRNLGEINYRKNDKKNNVAVGKKQARRNAFMLCTLHNAINAMVTHYKSVMCANEPMVNLEKVVTIVW